jgi:hypothetical protein
MTVLTTFASLSKNGFGPTAVTSNFVLNQYLTTFSTTSTNFNTKIVPTANGTAYITVDSTLGISRLDSNGNVVFTNTTTGSKGMDNINAINIDSTGNIYTVGANTTTTTNTAIIKYNSSGSILWQRSLTLGGFAINGAAIQFDNSNNPLVLYTNRDGANPSGINSRYFLSKFSNTGTLLNQRRVLLSTTSPVNLGVDPTGNAVIVAGTDYANTSHTSIYNGIYDFSNTTSNNVILTQTTTTDNYTAGPIVSDGTYYYQIGVRVIGGISKSVFMRIDKSTGAISYSKELTVNGKNPTLQGIAIDGSGYVYLTGLAAGSGGYFYVGKFEANTGNNVWGKTISNPTYSIVSTNSLAWSNGYIYYGTRLFVSPTYYHSYWKLRDNGSLPNGTWQTYFIVAATTTTSTAVNSSSTGTITDSPSTTTYANTTPTYSTGGSGLTATRTAIP